MFSIMTTLRLILSAFLTLFLLQDSPRTIETISKKECWKDDDPDVLFLSDSLDTTPLVTVALTKKKTYIQEPVRVSSIDGQIVHFDTEEGRRTLRIITKNDTAASSRIKTEGLRFEMRRRELYGRHLPRPEYRDFLKPRILNAQFFMMLESNWSQSRIIDTIEGASDILSQCGIYFDDAEFKFIQSNLNNKNLSKDDLNFVGYMTRDDEKELDDIRVVFTNIAKVTDFMSDYLRGGTAFPERYVQDRPSFSIGLDKMISPENMREMRAYEFMSNFVYMGHEGANHVILAHELGHILLNHGRHSMHSEDRNNLMYPVTYGTFLSKNQCREMRTTMPHLFKQSTH